MMLKYELWLVIVSEKLFVTHMRYIFFLSRFLFTKSCLHLCICLSTWPISFSPSASVTHTHTHKYSTFTDKIPAVPLSPSPRRYDSIIRHAPFISTCHRLVPLRSLFLLIVFLWPPPRHQSFSHTYQTMAGLAAFQLVLDETLRKLWLAKNEKTFPSIWN